MKALITGASSGIGLEMARILSREGFELILVAREKEKLQKVQEELGKNVKIVVADLSNESKLKELYVLCKNDKIDVLINNAGFGMKKRNSGYILNVASMAAFAPGPLMATYYSTKAYVLRLTTSIYEELRRDKSKVVVSCLCPGPVKTNFNNVANVKFSVKPLDSKFVAECALVGLFNKKLIIIPGFKMRVTNFFTRLAPTKLAASIAYNIQKKKLY